MIIAQTMGIGMYVAQFPEWARFSEQAETADFDRSKIKKLFEVTRGIVKKLEENPSIADPSVPRTIAAINELIKDPVSASKKAAFAVMRSLENMVASAFQYGISFIEKTMEKSVDTLSGTASKVAAIALVSMIASNATNIVPLTSSFGNSNWMRDAVDIVKREISKIKEAS